MKDPLQEKRHLTPSRIIFYISLIPYVVFLMWGLINCIISTANHNYLDLYALVEPIANFWFDSIIVDLNIFSIALTLFSVGYPIFYLTGKPVQKNTGTKGRKDNKEKSSAKELCNEKESKLCKSFIIYIITFIPYFYLVYAAIHGLDTGFFTTKMSYGYDAMFWALLIFCVVPIYPFALLFQIIYTVRKHKLFSKTQKIIVISLIIAIAVLTIVPSTVFAVNKSLADKITYDQNEKFIETYLKEEFGERHAANMTISELSGPSSFYITTPLLSDGGFSVCVNEIGTKVTENTFYKKFIEENGLQDKMDDYLSNLYGMPDGVKLQSEINKIDFSNYSDKTDLDTIFNSCEYRIISVYINVDYYNKQEIIQTIKDFYMKYDPILHQYYTDESINFYVEVNDKLYASIHTHRPTANNTVYLYFNGYTDANGTTIPFSEEEINLLQ